MNQRASAVAKLRMAASLLLFSAACAQTKSSPSFSSVTAPSPPPEATEYSLIVRVHARGSELPISRALVRYNNEDHYTDISGEARLTVRSGEETTIDVSAADYQSMQASAIVSGDERWTFYLEPQPNPLDGP